MENTDFLCDEFSLPFSLFYGHFGKLTGNLAEVEY